MFGLQSSQSGSGVARYASLFQTGCVRALLAALVFVICLTAAQSINAATYTVNQTGDAGDLTCDATCTLRDAIDDANGTIANDTIEFDATVFSTLQTIALGGTQLTIASNGTLIIDGGGKVIVSGSNQSRVFEISSGASATFNGLIVTGGFISLDRGGGIENLGMLTLTNSTISGNSLSNGVGGGIYNNSFCTLNVTNSTISGNFTSNLDSGGGIFNSGGTVNITNSTISNNTTFGGGSGGGIYNNDGRVNVINSTISHNFAPSVNASAGGGGIYSDGSSATVNVTNSTISNNSASAGGGIHNAGGVPSARNSIIAGNTATMIEPDYKGTLHSQGYNLIGIVGLNITIDGDTTGNILNQNAQLAPLGNYGGGTLTHALLSTSPAINAGTSTSAPGADQRGANRVGQTDIGAFEVNASYSAALPGGNVNQSYSQTIVPDRLDCTYTVTAGSLPPGLTFSASTAIVSISGTPTLRGNYSFDITANRSGATSTTSYSIAINGVPTISDIADLSTNEDIATGNINFTVGDVETAAGSLFVSATSDNQTLAPNANLTLGGSGANRTINITPVLNQFGSALITVTVTDAGYLTVTDTFTLTVNSVNDAPTISDIADTTTNEDIATGNINFTVGDVETAAVSLFVSATSDNQTLAPNANITLGGSGANRTININPALNQFGSATITIIVSDGALTGQDTFVLTVNPVGDIFIVDNPTDNGALSACTAAANDCSLRGAITMANAAADNDTIEFDAGVFSTVQTITLGGSVLTITNGSTLTINGSGKVRVSGNIQSRAFQINGGAIANLNGLTIIGGNNVDGGGISNFGTLNLTNSTISGNTATTNGAGIQNNSGGTVNLTNSTISGNKTTNGNSGGGVQNDGTMNLTNSTISDNSAVGGGSGGGVNNFGTFNSRNSIIAGNTAATGPDFGGTLNSQGYNLIGNTTNTNFTGDTTGNILDQDAQLGTLMNNGGGTFTQALALTSPAINAGSNALAVDGNNQPLAFDQRGTDFPRISNGTVDMGAFEFIVILTVDNTTNNGALSACTTAANDCSLLGAITSANNSTFDETVAFDPMVFSTVQTVTSPTNPAFTISNNGALTIEGGGKVIVSGTNQKRVFEINSGAKVTFNGLTIRDGVTNEGGGIRNNGTLNITNSTISGNSATSGSSGGGIFNSGTLNVTNSTISGNSAANGGGGIRNNGPLIVTNSTISGNSAAVRGGAIFNSFGTVSLINSTITGNSASNQGGGIESAFNSRNSIIAGNTAPVAPDIIGTLTSQGFNLVGNTTGTNINGDTTGNILNQNARLAPLGNYGGGTMTHALLSISPAVNAGAANNAPATDQRGANRVGVADIGAFELNNTANGGAFFATLPNGTQIVGYNSVITANSGAFNYSVTSGSLPTGISLNTNFAPNAVVALTGTPLQSGIFNFAITANNDGISNITNYKLQILGPTSATVSVSGRVLVGKDVGLRNANVILTDSSGNSRTAVSSSFGYYRFEEVEVGQTYIITISSKRYQYEPRVVSVTDEVGELNFNASP